MRCRWGAVGAGPRIRARSGLRFRSAALYQHRAANEARPRAGNCGPRMERCWQDACSQGEGREARWQAQSLDGCIGEWDEKPDTPKTTWIIQSPIQVGHHTRGPGRQRLLTRHRTTLGLGVLVGGDPAIVQGIPGARVPNLASGGPPWRLTSQMCGRSYQKHTPQSWKRQRLQEGAGGRTQDSQPAL
jgi:hypothetical protein